MIAKLPKRIKMSIGVFLTLLTACAWETNWFSSISKRFTPSSQETLR